MVYKIIVIILLSCILCYLLSTTKEHLKYQDPMLDSLKLDLMKLDPKASELKYFASDKSFTEDKKDMYICLKDEKGQYYPKNVLMYVMIHELAHAISHSYDDNHTGKEFNNNFDILLERASSIGIYNPREPFVANYCGVTS